MKKKYILLLVVFICEILLAVVIVKKFYNSGHNNFSEFTDVEVNSNTLYCSTFQLAWNELTDKLGLEKIEFENYSNSEIIDNLNKKSFTKDMINSKDYSIFVEKSSPQVLEKIKDYNITNYQLEKLNNTNSNGLVVLASLNKEFNFPEEFEVTTNEGTFNKIISGVTYFSLKDNDKSLYKDSVEVLYYHDFDRFDYGIKLNTTTDDEVILWSLREEKYNTSFEDLYKEMITLSESYEGSKTLEDVDLFLVPNINIESNINYNSLCGKEIKNSNGSFLSLASQHIFLNMNNGGVKFKSNFFAVTDSIGAPPTTARRFLYNVPFVLFLKEKKSRPTIFCCKNTGFNFLEIKK